ncbi:nucleoporin Nup186/Nup192/Nup205 [Boletus edulis]|nr:nucleoporin Nup186/Nup192/Nup205 [Boletus edulis]
MDSIATLRSVLAATLTARGHPEQDLFDDLILHKARLRNLSLDAGHPSPQEQRELQSGKITINGRSLAINADFAQQVIFLAQQLKCSEKYIASILHTIMAVNPNMGPSFISDVRHLVDCLRYLFEAAALAQLPDAPRLYLRLEAFVRQELVPASKPDASLASRIFNEIESIGTAVTQAQIARQNAQSNTIPPSGPGSQPSLGYDILDARYDSLKYERRYLSIVQKSIDWLAANPNDTTTSYILAATLAAFDSAEPHSFPGKGTIAYMKRQLAPNTHWKEPGLKATILLKWTLFMAETRHCDPTLENQQGFKTEELESQIWDAVQGDAFTYLATALIHSFAQFVQLVPEQQQKEPLAEEFQLPVLNMCDVLLRKIKQRQEDLLASVRTDRSRMFRSVAPPSSEIEGQPAPRNDIAMLYSLIGVLYASLPPERALQFWGATPTGETRGKLPSFLQWAVWSTQVRDVDMTMALYDMLSGLAKGQQCSELAYNFLARGGGEVIPGSSLPSSTGSYNAGPSISWSTIFALLDPRTNQPPSLAASFGGFGSLAISQPHPPTQQPPQHIPIGPKDVLLAQSFLRLLSTVATSSVAVRLAISSNTQFRAIPTLVSLVPLGAIFDALAAFCEPGAGSVWTLMERVEVINVRAVLPPVKGVEAVYKLYPATIPFLNLLATLLHTPKRLSPRSLLADAEPLNTIPESLGQPYRLPGIGLPRREYARHSERWRMNDLCLKFIENLVRASEDGLLRRETVIPLLIHPGFEVLTRLLTNSPLQSTILSYIVDGIEGFEHELPSEEPYFLLTIIRVLRIIHRVLEIQDVFLDVLVPILSEFDSAPFVGTVHSRSFYTRFDQALTYGTKYIPAIATYLVLLAVRIISQLSCSTSVTSLLTLIERSPDSERILSGFRQLLDVDSLDDVDTAETTAEHNRETQEPLDQAIRIAILDLLIRNTERETTYPNFGHFLLFGGAESEHQIQDPHAIGARRTCAHVILDLVNVGVPRMRTKGKDAERQRKAAMHAEPLFNVLPALSVRCYRIIYQLCVHPRTSDATMRYLHTREDFFARHLAVIPSKVPEVSQEPFIEVMYHDGSRVLTSVSTLRAFIDLRSRILDLAALDLHVLTDKGHHKGVLEILQILYGTEHVQDARGFDWEDGMGMQMQSFGEMGQSQLRVVEFVESLGFDWSDSLTTTPVDLEYLGSLNLDACVRVDPTGCEVVDQSALLSFLTSACRTFHSQGRITTTAQAEKLNAETTYILESCAIENHRREVAFAVATGYEAWRRLLDMTLTKCFHRLPHDRRENMLFDLLHVLPGIVRSDVQEATAVLLSEAILSTITKLREDRRHQIMLQSAGGDIEAGALPTERLYALVRSLLECVLDSNRSELVRGNLYACLINYLHLVSADDGRQDAEAVVDTFGKRSMALSVSALGSRDDLSLMESQGVGQRTSALEAGTLSVMKNVMERLVSTISRDAIDGTEVWKTVAFMLLDSLAHLCRADKSRTLVSFVRGLKEAEMHLQYVLKPDPDDLNPLYVYEAKMSLFTRMAQTRSGAERLLEAQILPILSQCEYLDTRPEEDQSFMDQDSFLPRAIQRYHQLFMPALQLVVAMLASLGTKHTTANNQALEFLSSHRDTIYIEEIHLLVSLSGSLLSLVPKSELLTMNTGFGGIHGAILGLAARCLGNGRCSQSVRPQTDSEIALASVFAPGHQSETKFDVLVRRQELLLRKSVIEYLGTASDFTEPEMTLVLSPVLSVPRQDERPPRVIATIPTVGDAIEALNSLCDDLAATLKQIADLSAELSSRDHIRVDTIQEVAFLQDLDIAQKRSLIHQAYQRLKIEFQDEVKTVLGTTEMLLLLLWRHLASYAETDPSRSVVPPPANMRTSMRLLPAVDASTFKDDVGKRLVGALTRISSLDLSVETVGRDWQSYQGYIEIMSRRLRDTVGLHELME